MGRNNDEIRKILKDKILQALKEEYKELWGEKDEKYLCDLANIHSNLYEDLTGNINRLQGEINHNMKDKRILDFGCGWGNFLIYCLMNGYNAFGVDVSTTRSKYFLFACDTIKLNKTLKSRYIIYDGENLPFKENTFDIVIANQVLEHVEDIENTIKEIRRILKRNGIFYIRSPDYSRSFFEPHYRTFWIPFFKGKIAEKYLKAKRKPTEGLRHLNFLSGKELKTILKENNFKILRDMEKKIIIDGRKKKIKERINFLPNFIIEILNEIYEFIRQIRMIGKQENQIDIIFIKE